MEWSIPAYYAEQFRREVQIISQQANSRLRQLCRRDPDSINGNLSYYNLIDRVEVDEITTRMEPTKYDSPAHWTRQIGLRKFAKAIPIETMDMDRMIDGGMSSMPAKYAQLLTFAMNRERDRRIIEAMGADVIEKTGDNDNVRDTRTLSFPAKQKFAHGNSGLTKDKFFDIKKILAKNETISMGDDQGTAYPGGGDKLCFVMSAHQVYDLYEEEKAINKDYGITDLLNGKINEIWGAKIITTELMPLQGNVRTCYALTERALGESHSGTVKSKMSELPAHNYNWQTWIGASFDYVRIMDDNIVQFECVES